MRKLLPMLLACAVASAPAVMAQEKAPEAAPQKAPEKPLDRYAMSKRSQAFAKAMILRSAEKMPEESYGFKPVETVRSFGQLLGHVADSQYYFCSVALGEKNPAREVEKTKTSKADLVAALRDAFGYCDKAYAGVGDAYATETVKLFGEDMSRLDALTTNTMHGVEHYGNLITYLRMKGIVPPSSEPRPTAEGKKQAAAR